MCYDLYMQDCNNIVKKIVVNVLLIVFLLLMAEVFCIIREANIIIKEDLNEKSSVKQIIEHLCSFIPYSYKEKREFQDLEKEMRSPAISSERGNKKQIIIAGCSFAYGYLLGEKDCIHTILSDITGRIVSNIAVPSGCQRETLWFFRNKDALGKYIVKNQDVDYVIYVRIDDHKRRLFFDLNTIAPQYKIADNGTKIEFLNDKLYRHTFLYRNLKLAKYYLTPQDKVWDLQNLFFREINKEIKKLFPNSRFVILDLDYKTDDRMKELTKDGIEIITLSEYFGDDFNKEEYLASDNRHPNGKFWKRTAEVLKEKLKL